MPFQNGTTGNFTREGIQALPSGLMGVFGIYRKDTWIYIGRGDIRVELLRYLGGENLCITAQGPTAFIYEATSNHIEREKQLLREIATACNQRVG